MDAAIARARDLRKSMTPEEARVWLRIRELRRQGHHFRRQAPISGYCPDFVCKTARLIVEIDGSQYGEEPQRSFDQRRDAQLRANGYPDLEVLELEIDASIDDVVETILAALAEHQ